MVFERRALLFFLLTLGCTVALAQAPEPATGELGAKVDSLFAEWDKPDTPGCAVAVVRGGKVLYAKGYGIANLEDDIAITPRTIFHVASVSKQFTAFGIMLLAQQGKLALDDDIRKYLPELPDFGEPITIRHLIHHTSGLRDQWDLLVLAGWRMDDVITRRQILRMVERQRELNFAPGTEHLYCNTGYTLLAEIIARMGKESFPEWMREHVFEPLGMTMTLFYDDHERIVKGRAYSYRRVGEDRFKKAVLNYANAGATSLFTTVEDLAKWVTNLAVPQLGGTRGHDQMLERGVLDNGEKLDYAFGLQVDTYRGLQLIGHSGGDAGFRSYAGLFPDQDLGVIVLSNLASFDPFGKAMDVADLYLGDQFQEPKPEERRPGARPPIAREVERDPLTIEELNDYTGRYYSPELETEYVLVIEDGTLIAKHQRHEDAALRVQTKDQFSGRGISLGRRIVFERDDAGRVTGMRISTGRVRNLRFEKRLSHQD